MGEMGLRDEEGDTEEELVEFADDLTEQVPTDDITKDDELAVDDEDTGEAIDEVGEEAAEW